MKKVVFFILLFCWSFSFSQLDTEHWFAPMAGRAASSGFDSNLYLSTNETTPFTVSIYNDNSLYTTVQISKGNPAEVYIPAGYMMSLYQNELFVPTQKGLYVKGPKKFFANYRFSVYNHAEIITSKGLAGLGTKFYAGMAANTGTATYINSTIGVIATEDNTTVTISDYNPNVVFSNGTSSPTRVFTLNKGQAYVLDVISSTTHHNQDGLIGAKITSNHPISVTNGNFNGIYTNNNFSNNDILMDQAVPVDRLGNSFVVVKGNAPVSSGMETLLVVATENNTEITVNGTPTGVILNEGDYTMIDGNNYVHQGNNNYNMSVDTSKNVYVYQLLGGTATGTVYAAGGFNFIPPLSCFMPNKVDEIGFINRIGYTTYNTKLNIITQTGAVVTLNGNPLAANNGPYSVFGNPNWVTYSVPNVSGNITVNSTKAVTAGIAAGSGAVGYGGYFAGFSSVPVITKTGDCFSGIRLQVDNSYDAYQWYHNGVIIPTANTYFINPELYGAGNYTVLVTKNNCESKLTNAYNYTLCPPMPTHTFAVGSCSNKQITPAFTTSTQSINPSLTQVVSSPTLGTVSVNSVTGIITYIPQTGLTTSTQDSFIYYIEGTGTSPDFEYIRVNIQIHVLQVNNAVQSSCGDALGNGVFDLTALNLTSDTNTTITYYTDVNLTNTILNSAAYQSGAGTIYANVVSEYGCSLISEIDLQIYPSPNINTANFNGAYCDENFDGVYNVDFSLITPQIVTNSTSFSVKYYLNISDANAGNTNNLPNIWNYSSPTAVFVRVEGLVGGCPSVVAQINFTLGDIVPLTTSNASAVVCDSDGNGSEQINLLSYNTLFSTDPAVTYSYFDSQINAQANLNALGNVQTITGTQIYFVRIEHPSQCPAIGQLTLSLETLTLTPATLTACGNPQNIGVFNLSNAVVTSNTGVTFEYFTNSTLTNPITNITNYSSANAAIYVKVKSANNCSSVTTINLVVNPSPNINVSAFNAALCDDNFDGEVSVLFSNVTNQIVSFSNQFNVRYYLNQTDATLGNGNTLPNAWTYSVNTVVYVRVDSLTGSCPTVFGQISFTIGSRIPLLTNLIRSEVCDEDMDGVQPVNLGNYKSFFSTNPQVQHSFYNSLYDAENDLNQINSLQDITGTHTFYIRLTSNTACPSVGEIHIQLKSPRKSDVLVNKTVCPRQKTTLDAGSGFTSYLWSTGETTSSIEAGEGDYYVDLKYNGCVFRQYVSVLTSEQPIITKIEINGSTATIHVIGGEAPYMYSLDGINYQLSNVFTGLNKGGHRVYVQSVDKCQPVVKEFLILNLVNAITPNGDGMNDRLDYSDLRTKKNVSIEIFDRYGMKIYQAKTGDYVWDGTLNGRPLRSDTYWYVIKWTEEFSNEMIEYTGWILLKNRK